MVKEHEHFAHSLPPPCGKDEWEPLYDHLTRVADGDGHELLGAAQFAIVFGGEQCARLLGLWHDLGKYSKEFQAYLAASTGIRDSVHGSEIAGRVDHSTAGAKHAESSFGPVGKLLAYCIAGHHAGLPDNEGGEASLSKRLRRLSEDSNRLRQYTEALAVTPPEVLSQAQPTFPKLRCLGDRQRAAFATGFLTRMLFSCLVDADFLATEWFMNRARATQRPKDAPSASQLLACLCEHLEKKQLGLEDTPVNRHRGDVLVACRAKAELPPGFFSLNVPTGGGKTLSSLAFALTHAAKHDLHRVIYAIPFTSIIEQTVDVFREALREMESEVLEHHSSMDPDDPSQQSDRSRLAAENFDSPLIVTTNVQLFESLFASRTSRCRKLHRLAKSVIILDEAQTLPPNLLAPTLAALEELVCNYGTTVVLCTATQPAIEKRERFPIGLVGVRPIIDKPEELHRTMRRTQVEAVGPLANDQVIERLRASRQILCIVNSRRHAADLFKLLDDPDALHISAFMCAAHRSDTVAEIRQRLGGKVNKPCRVICTQVIEAGVDVDFPLVYRAVAGLDSIAQASGRCNREGKLRDVHNQPRLGHVIVFDYDVKEYPTERMIQMGAAHFREVSPDHEHDLLSPEAIEGYFRLHYWQQGADDGSGWDRGRDQQSVMRCFGGEDGNPVHQQFRQAAEAYCLIEDAQTPIIVLYGLRGESLIRELEIMPEFPEPQYLRAFDRRAQRYVVGVHRLTLDKLLRNQALLERHGRFGLMNSDCYKHNIGLTFDDGGFGAERTIV